MRSGELRVPWSQGPRGPTGPKGTPCGPTGPHRAPWGPMGPHGPLGVRHGGPWVPFNLPFRTHLNQWAMCVALRLSIRAGVLITSFCCSFECVYHSTLTEEIARPSIMVGIRVRWCHELGLSIKCPRACAPRSPNFNVGMIEAPRGSLTRQEKNNRFCSGRSSKLVGNIEIGGAGGHDPVQRAPQPFISDTMVASCL